MSLERNLLFTTVLSMGSCNLLAATYDLPLDGSNVVGKVASTEIGPGETLADVGRRTDMGLLELIEANPNVHPWRARAGTKVIIPSRFILPPGPHRGIVINLPELRLYYYHPDGRQVSTYPLAIGKLGWGTPVANTKVVDKTENPSWVVPPGIMQEKIESGIHNFPKVIPPGPKNPLGKYAMRLGIDGYLIHGTNLKGGIGSRVSHGCMRMVPADIEELFPMVSIGTPVRIIHETIKVGFSEGEVYIEAHKPLSERAHIPFNVEHAVQEQLNNYGSFAYHINWEELKTDAKLSSGIPTAIGSYQNRESSHKPVQTVSEEVTVKNQASLPISHEEQRKFIVDDDI